MPTATTGVGCLRASERGRSYCSAVVLSFVRFSFRTRREYISVAWQGYSRRLRDRKFVDYVSADWFLKKRFGLRVGYFRLYVIGNVRNSMTIITTTNTTTTSTATTTTRYFLVNPIELFPSIY